MGDKTTYTVGKTGSARILQWNKKAEGMM